MITHIDIYLFTYMYVIHVRFISIDQSVVELVAEQVVVERRHGGSGLQLRQLRRSRLPLREHDVHLNISTRSCKMR
jgi:hypothetical protein